jgi:hypothetical protein
VIPGMSPKSEEGGGEDGSPPPPPQPPSVSPGDQAERMAMVPPPGGRKRDTMIRELKSKLKEKFPTNTLASVTLAVDPAGPRVKKPQFRWDRLTHLGSLFPWYKTFLLIL